MNKLHKNNDITKRIIKINNRFYPQYFDIGFFGFFKG